MVTISILANTVRPSVDPRSDDTAFGAVTFSLQDSVHCWKPAPGEVMTVENLYLQKGRVHQRRVGCLTFFGTAMVRLLYDLYKETHP